MVTKTSTGFSEEVWGTAEGSTGSWTLELNNYYYYIQIRLRNGTLVGIRDLDLTYEKRAVE